MKSEIDLAEEEYNEDDKHFDNECDDENFEGSSQEDGELFFTFLNFFVCVWTNLSIIVLFDQSCFVYAAQKTDDDGFDKPKLATQAELGI